MITEYEKYKCIRPKILNVYGTKAGAHDRMPFATPCGKCLYCRQQKASEWNRRLELEYLDHKTSSFLTLTYKETNPFTDYDNFAKSRELTYTDIQTFMKRARRHIEYKYEGQKFKFFCSGEYGKRNTQRAHWHLLIFGLTGEQTAEIAKLWEYGITDEKEVEGIDGVSRYVSSYVLDKIDLSPDEYEKKYKRKAPFHRGSQGLGLKQALENFTLPALMSFKEFQDFSHIVWKGQRVKFCRYLRNKIADKLGILEELKRTGIEKMQDYMKETISLYQWYGNKASADTRLKIIRPAGTINIVTPEMLTTISNAWDFRHRRKFENAEKKFNLYLLDKLTKACI